ncbi:hypothetical protein T492DRAFT_855763 [Pavlovales sp. CCMP2436]|nr:hypothetical protein T492DRAFT_855763 [Pavlovales sp. CCMP2436]
MVLSVTLALLDKSEKRIRKENVAVGAEAALSRVLRVKISFSLIPRIRFSHSARKRLQRFVFGFLIIHHFYQLPTSA